MRVRVRLYGSLRRFSLPGTPGLWEGELPPGARISDLIKKLGADDAEVAIAARDGKASREDFEIPEGAEIALAPPVGGG
ncbi:MAG TPA: MoaD/ThiS family protein [Spirochaetia bacterium]|nr:MoaD/ThiS family protein [Spirochaetia bacterium]